MRKRDMQEPNNRRASRRILWLGIGVLVAIGLYTAGWFWLANKIESETLPALATLEKQGIKVECTNPVARGYPFRIGLYCDRVTAEQPEAAVTVSAGAFRSAGQIYDPFRIVAELDAPATVSTAAADPLTLDWKRLRASVRLAQPLPERISLEGWGLKASRQDGAHLVSASSFEGHMRPNGADLDLATRFEGLAIDPALVEGRKLPPLAGEADLSLKDGVQFLGKGADDLRGRSGQLREVTLRLGEKGALKLSGPFSVDQDGLIDADLQVAVTDPLELASSLAEVFPEQADKIRQGFAGLAFLGSSPKVPLRIAKGTATLGFIPLGTLPPLM
ncbi:DUF2125 domain-containing protein [Pseudaminobacter sp. 19-2017]|uniref:DUF2125 domain-containing protein n=2 Tax=Pseudaminobacter soli (ex Zhang et al. 2022) TaxID=2831468 RepID=A0A942DZX9_9HYPH|nr:DUF2125 domain-containing protein [Pseudaminobacter soli]